MFFKRESLCDFYFFKNARPVTASAYQKKSGPQHLDKIKKLQQKRSRLLKTSSKNFRRSFSVADERRKIMYTKGTAVDEGSPFVLE